ncbi:MAG: DUF5063 domain-containing protein [Tetrasphaera sp.]|nr:DUF5063 domain-containing protein [Tetrasphaera sp.]
MSDHTTGEDLRLLGDDCAHEARVFVDMISAIATGEAPQAALSMGLLGLSQVLLMGARLGAMQDVVLAERFEPDPGPDVELDGLRAGLAILFEGLDDYADVVDPVTDATLTSGSLSNDLTVITSALTHGLAHHEAGRIDEALWWWQFSYLADWGERAAMALRVLHSLLAHVRLDADEDTVAEAEFDALHP